MERSVELRGRPVDFGIVPLEFDGFSDRRKLIAWDRHNDRLALIAGLS